MRRIANLFDDLAEVTVTFWTLFGFFVFCTIGIVFLPLLLWRKLKERHVHDRL